MLNNIEKALVNLRQQKPLVLNLTNFVTMDFVANCLLALGAAPIMSVFAEELEELVAMCSTIYINIGTLDASFIDLSEKAIDFAKQYNKPIVFDPVGVGATKMRTQTAISIAPHATIIRGNASEIMALGEGSHTTKGVESIHTPECAKEIAKELARQYQAIIAVSGPIDFVTDGTASSEVAHGSHLMPLVTGMGCAVTAVMAAFKAVVDDPFEASVLGAYYFALCGEMAAFHSKHPGSFRSHFIDQLHRASSKTMEETNAV